MRAFFAKSVKKFIILQGKVQINSDTEVVKHYHSSYRNSSDADPSLSITTQSGFSAVN